MTSHDQQTQAQVQAENAPASPLIPFLDSRETEFVRALPANALDWHGFRSAVLSEAAREPRILRCCVEHLPSVAATLLTAARLGLSVGDGLGQFHLIPRNMSFRERGPDGKERKGNRWELHWIIGYRGLIELAYRSPRVQTVQAVPVWSDDEFAYHPASATPIRHRVNLEGARGPGELRAAYCIVFLRGSTRPYVHVASRTELEDVKAAAISGKERPGPWGEHFVAMSLKTVTRRALERVPRATVIAAALAEESRERDHVERAEQADIAEAQVQAQGAGRIVVDSPDETRPSVEVSSDLGGDARAEEPQQKKGEHYRTKSKNPPRGAREGDSWFSEETGKTRQLRGGMWHVVEGSDAPETKAKGATQRGRKRQPITSLRPHDPVVVTTLPEKAVVGECVLLLHDEGECRVWNGDEWEQQEVATGVVRGELVRAAADADLGHVELCKRTGSESVANIPVRDLARILREAGVPQ